MLEEPESFMPLPLRVLVAEDEADDVWLLRRAFAKAGVQGQLAFVGDSRKAIEYLQAEVSCGEVGDSLVPMLLVLKLKMPHVDGFQVLEWLGQQLQLQGRVMAVVLTDSHRKEDLHRAYALGAHHCLMKPNQPDELVALVRRLESYWREFQAQNLLVGQTPAVQALPGKRA